MFAVMKWSGIALGVALLLATLAVAAIYGASEYQLRRYADAPTVRLAVPGSAAAIAQGRHVAVTRGCFGCHGQDLGGKVFFDDRWEGRLVAANLTLKIGRYTDPQLARILRHGVRPDGTAVIGMPSATFHYLSDQDLGRLIAFLRSVPKSDNKLPVTHLRLLGRIEILRHPYRLAAHEIQQIGPPMDPGAPAATVAYGSYLAHSVCTECHGLDLDGEEGFTPNLIVAKAYSREKFTRLMRHGIALDGRDPGLMGQVARGRFSHFDDTEIAALYAYLQARDGLTGRRQ
jgi:mono/diheme cytochrome c family protein